MKTKLLSLLVLLGLFFFGATAASAASNPDVNKMEKTSDENIFYDPSEDSYYDVTENGYISEVFRVEGGKIVESVPVEDYVKIEAEESLVAAPTRTNTLNTTSSFGVVTPYAVTYSYIYLESQNYETRIYGSRASIIQENPGPGPDSLQIAYGYTYNHSVSASLGSSEMFALEAGVGYEYSRQESVESTHLMTIEAGYSGYWRFDPRVRKTIGTMRTLLHGQYYSSRNITAQYPTSVNGMIDGWLVAVKTKL